MTTTHHDVLRFWFEDHGRPEWFGGGPAFDALVRTHFAGTHARAVAGELYAWRDTAEGRLAEIIVLDQFSRQLYRKQARAFAADPQALVLAQELVRSGGDAELDRDRKTFAYLPFMHAESLAMQDESVRLFTPLGEPSLPYAREHRDIIARFGRYPYRNAALGRTSTPEERAWLEASPDTYGQ